MLSTRERIVSSDRFNSWFLRDHQVARPMDLYNKVDWARFSLLYYLAGVWPLYTLGFNSESRLIITMTYWTPASLSPWFLFQDMLCLLSYYFTIYKSVLNLFPFSLMSKNSPMLSQYSSFLSFSVYGIFSFISEASFYKCLPVTWNH